MSADYRIAIEWDIETWSRALRFFEKCIESQSIKLEKGLEIGARKGGLSWFFAKKYRSRMVCTDFKQNLDPARQLHEQAGLAAYIQYADADACKLPFPDGSFDFVVFKSVLGAIGRQKGSDGQQQAMAEIHRVLAPGGVLFFAENMKASYAHQWARRLFVPWGKSWQYVRPDELRDWCHIFEHKKIRFTGFFAAFVHRPGWLKTTLAYLDALLPLPASWRYVAYGVAKK